jgi:hypothetical protein
MDIDVPVPPQYQASPLRGVKYDDLLSVLNFMHHEEVHVAQEELQSFLTLAGKLGVTGFTPAVTELPYPTLPRPYLALPKPPYLMDMDVPVPRIRRCGSAMSPPLQECPGLPLTTEGFARPSYPSLAFAKPVGYPSPSTFPPSSATRDHSQEIQHCPGCCCTSTTGHPNLPRGITTYHGPASTGHCAAEVDPSPRAHSLRVRPRDPDHSNEAHSLQRGRLSS